MGSFIRWLQPELSWKTDAKSTEESVRKLLLGPFRARPGGGAGVAFGRLFWHPASALTRAPRNLVRVDS